MRRYVAAFLNITRWLTLALSGWMAYALLRGLWTIIYVGAPLYDWQWYPPVITLLIGLPIYIACRLPRTWPAFLALTGVLVWVVVGYNGFGQVVYLDPGRVEQIPVSFWAYPDLRQIPEPILQDVRAAGGRIYLDPGERPFQGEHGQALAEGLGRLAQYHIEVYLMVGASDFLSVPVHREWMANAQAAAAFVRQEGFTNVRGLIGDAEPPLKMPLDILGVERASFIQAAVDLRDGVNTLRAQYPGSRVGITATGPQYLDRLDGDSDLSVVMRSPVDPPGGWDFVNMMTYSSYLPSSWRAYYIYLAERGMTRLYPDGKVSHLIGLVGGGFPGEPLLDFNELARDARLSRALCVREIVVFQLNGALKAFGDDFVQRLAAAVNGSQLDPVAVPFSRPVSVLMYALAGADALLDVQGWRGLVWIGWMILSAVIVRCSVANVARR